MLKIVVETDLKEIPKSCIGEHECPMASPLLGWACKVEPKNHERDVVDRRIARPTWCPLRIFVSNSDVSKSKKNKRELMSRNHALNAMRKQKLIIEEELK